jgi:Uma2 family endonuclease
MAALTIELPSHKERTAFNLRRWAELLDDPELARIEGRVETDRHGHIIMSPPPAPSHGSYQSRISYLLQTLLNEGRTLSECPISTADGVKAADVAWASAKTMKALGNRACFPTAPEICVEVISRRNTQAEIAEKKSLYFEAGAQEVWLCSEKGAMGFYLEDSPRPSRASKICPGFPQVVELA